MKKFWALLLTLTMLVSCTAAVAEEAVQPANVQSETKFAFNEELLTMLMTQGAQDEQSLQLAGLVSALLNNMGVAGQTDGLNDTISATLKGMPVFTIETRAAEDGSKLVVSDLFPSYVLSVPAEMFEEAGVSALQELMTMDKEAAMAKIAEAMGPSMTKTVENGEYTFGEYTFNTKVTAEIDMEMAMKNLAAAFPELQEMIPAETVEAEVEGEEEAEPQMAYVDAYATLDEKGNPASDVQYYVFTMEDEYSLLYADVIADQAGFDLYLITGGNEWADLDAMEQAAKEGSEDVVLLEMSSEHAEVGGSLSMEMRSAGVYAGIDFTAAENSAEIALYAPIDRAMIDQPLVVMTMTYAEPESLEFAPIDMENKTVINLAEAMMEEDGATVQALMMDVMTIGLNNLMANAAMAMPEEVTALITLMSAPPAAEEGVSVEGVEE